MRFKNYINEKSSSNIAFWISPKGEITDTGISHINLIIRYPEKFGFTLERIREMYASYGEPIGHEGKARREIVKKVVRKGFIRIRKYPNQFYSVNVLHSKLLNFNNLTEWAKKLITTGIGGVIEKDVEMPVIITDLGKYHKEITLKELAEGKLSENSQQEYFLIEKHVSEWENFYK